MSKIFKLLSIIAVFYQSVIADTTVCSSLTPCSIDYDSPTIQYTDIIRQLPSACTHTQFNSTTEIDWSDREKNPCLINVVNPPSSNLVQGTCGSCYAFAAAGAIESAYAIKNLLTFDTNITTPIPPAVGFAPAISPQQIMDCSYNYETLNNKIFNEGCNGGAAKVAYRWASETSTTLCTSNSYPYRGKRGICNPVCTPVTTVFSQTNIPSNNTAAILSALNFGPVSVVIQADKPIFTNHVSVYSLNPNDCGQVQNHAVLLVGVEPNPFDPTKSYWKIRNSWGAKVGAFGYWYLLKDGYPAPQGQCGIAIRPSQPVLV
jgi:hypothetical protein